MPKKPLVSDDPAELRRRAEARLRERSIDPAADPAARRVFHELEVHQVELELQNAELHRTRNELEAALERYVDLYDFAPVGYLSVDAAGAILEANLTGAAALGVERSQLIGRPLPSFVSPTHRPAVLAFLDALFAGSDDRTCEALCMKKGGGTFWADFRATPATTPEGTRSWCRVVFRDITASRQAEEAQRRLEAATASNRELSLEISRRQVVEESLRRSQRRQRRLFKQSQQMQSQLRHMTHRILHAQEEERKRISRELHDDVVQSLVSINIRLAALSKTSAGNLRSFRRQVALTQRQVVESVDAVHRFARELRPTALDDLGLVPALNSFLKDFSKRTGIRARLSAFPSVERLSMAKRTVLYRVAHEALTNVARHAAASRVEVTIQRLPDRIRMTIADDGKSFSVRRMMHARVRKHLGLLGMKERVEMHGGLLSVESSPGKGTAIIAEIRPGKDSATRKPLTP